MTEHSRTFSSVRIGHWTNPASTSGCSVLLFDSLTPAVVDVRGGAPGTRETDLLGSGRTVRSVDAIVLTGGSAFGLASADGVMRYLREVGRGYATAAGAVPIVSAAVIFDLRRGGAALPDAESGYLACQNAVQLPLDFAGRVGGGAGATIRKLWGPEHLLPGGLGVSTVETAFGSVTSVLVLNAAGAPCQGDAKSLDRAGSAAFSREVLYSGDSLLENRESTAIGAIIVEGTSDYALLERCAISAHVGLARSISPAHTVFDGDVFFAAGLNPGLPDRGAYLALPTATEVAVEHTIEAILAL
ncbi:P1 family peptidase [soil metagenome]